MRWVAAPRGWIGFLSLALAVATSLFMETADRNYYCNVSGPCGFVYGAAAISKVVSLVGIGVTCLGLFVFAAALAFGSKALTWQSQRSG